MDICDFAVGSYDEEHFRAVELLEGADRGRVLDLPAGPGRLSWMLAQKGHGVVAGDIKPEIFKDPEIPIVKMNLQETFPFRDSSFDAAFLIEGPEHLENIYSTFREYARILKPGGRLILSLPNYSNLETRLKILFYGIAEPVTSAEELRNASGNGRDLPHVNRPLYPLLRMALDFAGFEIERVESVNPKKKQWLLFPLFILIKIFTIIKGKKGDMKYWIKDSNRKDILMGGNALMVKARILK